MKKNIGTLSLIIAAGGFITLESLLHFKVLEGTFWRVLCTGFEAGTVGAMADWFAVSALFKEIPIPLLRRHTNIIAKNRIKMTDAVVDLVTNQWLSPQIISEKLQAIDFVEKGLLFLKKTENQDRCMDLVQNVLFQFVYSIDEKTLGDKLKELLSDHLQQFDLGKSLGSWLEKSIKNGDHNQIWEQILTASENTLNHPETRTLLLKKLELASESYANQSWSKSIMMTLGKSFNAIDLEQAVDELMTKANEFITDAKNNTNHPVRHRFDAWLLNYAHRLNQGEALAKSQMDTLINRLLANAELDETLNGLLSRFKNTLAQELSNKHSGILAYIRQKMNVFITDLEKDSSRRKTVNGWIHKSISSLLDEFHSEIGNMVRESMNKLDDQALIYQIEDKVGEDLQYIRLNGAVVGASVGMCIAIVKLMLGILYF